VLTNTMREAPENAREGNRDVYFSAWASDQLDLRRFPPDKCGWRRMKSADGAKPYSINMDEVTATYLECSDLQWEFAGGGADTGDRLDCVAVRIVRRHTNRRVSRHVASWAEFFACFSAEYRGYVPDDDANDEVRGAPAAPAVKVRQAIEAKRAARMPRAMK